MTNSSDRGEKPTLVCLCGLPRAGKSTWARLQGHPVVNPDAVRLAIHGQAFVASAEPYVWAVAKTMVKALFGAGHPVVILDATNVTRQRRREWVCADWVTYFRAFDTPENVCVERAVAGNTPALVPVIARMAAQWEPLREDEQRWEPAEPTPPAWVPRAYPHVSNNGILRRNRIDLFCPAETAIRGAMLAVEWMPPDVRLTEAGNLLAAARDKVADFVESPEAAKPL